MAKNIFRMFLFSVSLVLSMALGVGAAHATPHDEWCDQKYQQLSNLCNTYYNNGRPGNDKYLATCFKTVNDWYADCRRDQNAYPDEPCISAKLPRPDGVDFAPACGTATS